MPNGVATSIEVSPSYNNSAFGPLGSYIGTVTHYIQQNNNPKISFADIQSDFSIIHLAHPLISGAAANFMRITPDFMGGQVHVDGYPAAPSGYGADMVNNVQNVTVDSGFPGMFDGASLGGASSGSPVWTYGADGVANVVGIVSAENSSGQGFDVRLTSADAAEFSRFIARPMSPF